MPTTSAIEQAQAPLFLGMPTNHIEEIIAAARSKEFTRGEMLYFEGDQTQQTFLLTSGFVKVTRFGASGTEVTLRLNGPGDVLGAVDLLSSNRNCTSAQAFRLCRTLVWEAPVFKAVMRRFPALQKNLVGILGDELGELEERFREMATERVGQRVACQLVRLAKRIGRSVNDEVELCLSREELAQMTGTTLFTVSRLLSAWEARGAVKPRRGAVMICNLHWLREIGSDQQPDQRITGQTRPSCDKPASQETGNTHQKWTPKTDAPSRNAPNRMRAGAQASATMGLCAESAAEASAALDASFPWLRRAQARR